MDVRGATASYENWMRRCGPVVEKHLRDKHSRMRNDPFQFLRGTYYRWAQIWPEICAECDDGPKVLAIGDLHVDSFGTWRDAEGRLCWGVDDFDEAFHLPYANDLVRLVTSVKIARKLGLLDLRTRLASDVILEAYEHTLRNGGCPIVLAEEETGLEKLGMGALKAPSGFWEKLNARPAINGQLPHDAKIALERVFPDMNAKFRVVRREAGLGSLGQQRFVAIGECLGGFVAREAKRLLPAANGWLNGSVGRAQSHCRKIAACAIRSPDPYYLFVGSWLVRRLSPDSNPIHLEELSGKRDEETLLHAMGTEVANVHLGNRRAAAPVLRDLQKRNRNWLIKSARKMAKIVIREWKEYRDAA